MTYRGTTEVSTNSNPPMRIAGAFGGINTVSTAHGGGRGVWLYNTTDGSSLMAASNYFSDAKQLGMQTGDLIMGTIGTGSTAQPFLAVLGTVSTSGAALSSTSAALLQGS